MKHTIKTLTVAMTLALLFAACERENTGFEPGTEPSKPSVVDEMGYISFNGGELFVEWEGENVNTPTEGDTRAVTAPDTDKFQISINRVSPKPEAGVVTGTYGELKAQDVIELPRIMGGEDCLYEIEAYSGELKPVAYDDEEGQPTYRGKLETPFKIEAEYNSEENPKNMEDKEIKCSLESIMVSVSMEESMAELSKNVSFKVSNSDSQVLTFNNDKHHFGVARMVALEEDPTFKEFVKEPSYGYLKQVNPDGGDDLTLSIDLVYNDQHVTQSFTANPDAKAIAGQHRKILLYMISNEEEVREGHIIIGVKVETWVYGEEVVVDAVTKAVFQAEPTLPDHSNDPDAPQFDGSSFNFVDGTANVAVSAADYEFGVYTGSAQITVSAQSDIKSFAVQITSTDKAYQAKLAEVGLTEGTGIDIVNNSFITRAESDAAVALVRNYGFRANSIDGKVAQFNIGGFFNTLLDEEYVGTHTITMYVEDASGHKSTNKLVVTNDGNGGGNGGGSGDTGDGPTITWPGKDIDETYDVGEDGLEVKILIQAPAVVEHLYVRIYGAINLGDMMPDYFDLADPDEYKPGLADTFRDPFFGFPVEGEVHKTELTFDITNFMSLLGSFKGESHFELTVVDYNKAEVTKTIHLNIL